MASRRSMRDAVVYGGRGLRRGSSDTGRSSVLADSKSSLTAAEEQVICERQDKFPLVVRWLFTRALKLKNKSFTLSFNS